VLASRIRGKEVPVQLWSKRVPVRPVTIFRVIIALLLTTGQNMQSRKQDHARAGITRRGLTVCRTAEPVLGLIDDQGSMVGIAG
jgi:hypothetical protein